MRIPYHALLSIPLVLSTNAMANSLVSNWEFLSPSISTDYHIKLTSPGNILVYQTMQCTRCSEVNNYINWAPLRFNPPAITGNDSKSVMLDWHMPPGAFVAPRQWEHVGIRAISPGDQDKRSLVYRG